MKSTQLILIVAAVVVLAAIIWLVLFITSKQAKNKAALAAHNKGGDKYNDITEKSVAQFFTEDFREELRNSGRMHFEQSVSQNAALINQGLNAAVTQFNKQTEEQLNVKMNQELAGYAKAMQDARTLVSASVQKGIATLDSQQQALIEAMAKDMATREAALLKAYEINMAKIIEHYLLEALGGQFDLKTQLPAIIAQMESNKQAMIEDMKI